jgi:hypothetical protein
MKDIGKNMQGNGRLLWWIFSGVSRIVGAVVMIGFYATLFRGGEV